MSEVLCLETECVFPAKIIEFASENKAPSHHKEAVGKKLQDRKATKGSQIRTY